MPDDPLQRLPAATASATFRNVPQDAEAFGTVRKPAETFRTARNDSAAFGNVPARADRQENHTLTVREVARRFERAGVARTERSIVNWCQANAQGVARLDAYYDPNERKYYITPQSADLAIAEEQAKAAKLNAPGEPVGELRNASEAGPVRLEDEPPPGERRRMKELEAEVLDLKITNRGKDLFIEQLRGEREKLLEQALVMSRQVGELETRLLQLEAPDPEQLDAR